MNVKKILVATVITSGFVLSVQASDFKSVDKSGYTKLCMTAIQGNRAAMHNTIKASGLSHKFVAENVQCNGENILTFVQQHGKNASNMLKMLDRRSVGTSITDIAMNTLEKN